MKKYLLLLVTLMSIASWAQENDLPLVEQGKKWTYHHANNEYVWDYYYTLKGDTVVSGKNCLKMYSDNKGNDGEICYEGSLFEEGKKVYCFYPEKDEANLLYDFDCKVGDTLKIGNVDLITLSIDTIVGIICKGEHYDFQAQWYDEDMGEPFVMGTLSWVKGVGATLDFFNMLPLVAMYSISLPQPFRMLDHTSPMTMVPSSTFKAAVFRSSQLKASISRMVGSGFYVDYNDST